MEAARAQFALPAQKHLSGDAAQRYGPVRVGGVDGAPVIGAQLAGKPQDEVFLLAFLRGQARFAEHALPRLLGELSRHELADFMLAFLHHFAVRFRAARQFVLLEMGDQTAECIG